MKLTSPAFEAGGVIPSKYTCDGRNISPPLHIEDIPDDAASLALIVDDPDAPAGTWDHWILFNIPATTTDIGEDSSPGTPGTNDFRKQEYGGPCPPSGTHRYFFKLYALDTKLDLEAGLRKRAVEKAMKDHVLAEAELMGRYTRQR
jgi:Raf kinase inhibitor-like YbhB/YbcL family protein